MVEEKTETVSVVNVNIDNLLKNSVNLARKGEETTTESIARTADSIKAVGLLQYPNVMQTKEGYELIFGFGRCRAAKLIGWKTIPCVVVGKMDRNARIETQLIENTVRDGMSRSQVNKVLRYLKGKGYDTGKLSTLTGMAPASVKLYDQITNALAPVYGEADANLLLDCVPLNTLRALAQKGPQAVKESKTPAISKALQEENAARLDGSRPKQRGKGGSQTRSAPAKKIAKGITAKAGLIKPITKTDSAIERYLRITLHKEKKLADETIDASKQLVSHARQALITDLLTRFFGGAKVAETKKPKTEDEA